MKILILSLQRLGDALQHLELVERIKNQHRDAEIHLLVNDSVKIPGAMLGSINKVHYFPRTELQMILTNRSVFILRAHKVIKETLQSLQNEKFTACYNLTHTQAAADLVNLLGITPSYGVGGDFENIWSTILSETTNPVRSRLFQINDLLAYSTGLGRGAPKASHRPKGKKIILQPLTSDLKKNWGLKNFSELFAELVAKHYDVSIIAADFERKELESWFPEESIRFGNLNRAIEWLSEASLLISGDTAILHLAARLRVQSIGLYLGSGDVLQTAPLMNGPALLYGNVDCYPCKHSAPCPKIKHFCAEALSVDRVLQTVEAQFSGVSVEGAAIVKRGYLDQIVVRERTYVSFEREVQQFAFASTLDQVSHPEVGSFALHLAEAFPELPEYLAKFDRELGKLETQQQNLEKHFQKVQLHLSKSENFRQYAAEMMTVVAEFQIENPTLGWDFFPLVEALSERQLTNFLKLREIKRALEFLQKSRDTKARVLSQLLQKAQTKERSNVQQF
ncbi:MAG: glycosyltransferase family 9 protein [Pseudobdellovibrionaceae bacterium]